MSKARILCVDDESSSREALQFILKNCYEVVSKADGNSGIAAIRAEGPFDVVLLDMKMPDMNGLEVLSQILQLAPVIPVVMITATTDAKTAVQAMKIGAKDYLNKPFDVDEIRLVIERVLKENAPKKVTGCLRDEPPQNYKFENIIGSSVPMQQVYALIKQVIDTETTVLITGETGTGKELVARALHYNRVRQAGPFVPVHCATIPHDLLESELFGHEKGAFSGALHRRIGMFEVANGGTLFLDEIGEMPLGMQSKLLRAIQEREIRRVGGSETIHINVRLVCATNRDLAREIKKGIFREDLFYRINVLPIKLPPLRERRDDIPTLVQHFTQRFAEKLKRAIPQISPAAMERFVDYSWPGNVRELEHAVERLLVTCNANHIDIEHLPFIITQTVNIDTPAAAKLVARVAYSDQHKSPEIFTDEMDLPKLTDNLERQAIEVALRRSNGVLTNAAKALKITRRMLRYKMDKFSISSDKAVLHGDETTRESSDSSPV